MARTASVLPEGSRITDFISLGVITSRIPRDQVDIALEETGRQSKRIRQLPAHVMIYYVIALALYMDVSYGEVLRCLLEGLAWLGEPARRIRNSGRSAISQARTRLGPKPLKHLFQQLAGPIGVTKSKGVWYRDWRTVSIDGMTVDVGDTPANNEAFGRPAASRGSSAFPQIRTVGLVECGTHVLFDVRMGPYGSSEIELAREIIPALKPGMLCLADRNFYSFDLWKTAAGTRSDLLWRVKKNIILPCEKRLPDGSYLSTIYLTTKHRRRAVGGIKVRVVEYRLEGVEDPEPIYRLMTTILDCKRAPANELAALYHERWEIENVYDELKIHLRGPRVVLRSKTPDLVEQEFYGLLLAHLAVRGLMHEAALQGNLDVDDLSFVHAVRVVKRKIPKGSFPPSA